MASMLDFAVPVLDDRITFANSERFPQATQVICNSFAAGIADLQIRATDYVNHPGASMGWGMSAADSVRHAL